MRDKNVHGRAVADRAGVQGMTGYALGDFEHLAPLAPDAFWVRDSLSRLPGRTLTFDTGNGPGYLSK